MSRTLRTNGRERLTRPKRFLPTATVDHSGLYVDRGFTDQDVLRVRQADEVTTVDNALRSGRMANQVNEKQTNKEIEQWLRHLHMTSGTTREWLSTRMRSAATWWRRWRSGVSGG